MTSVERPGGEAMDFNSNFNEELAIDSKYFSSLKAMMDCVQKNVDAAPAD